MGATNIYNKLLEAIGNPFGVCGLMGNIKAESGMKSTNMENSYEARLEMNDASYTQAVDNGSYANFATDRVGYGLCQWTSSGRKAALLAFAKEKGKSIGDEDMQIDFLIYELSNSYKNVLSVLKSATSVKEASDIVVTKFERPANQSEAVLEKRASYGQVFYDEFVRENEKMATKIIAVDAGHGLGTAGKRTMKSIDANETKEWWLNNRIADRLEELLAGYDCKIIRVDDTTGAKDISLADRVSAANKGNADVYISIHHNAGINGGSGGGTVVFYYSSKAERATQAKELYDAIVAKTGLIGNRSEKVIKKGFHVIKNTSMPAFLIENGFMDSKTDTPIILTAEHAEKTTQGILNFLVEEFDLAKKNVTTKPTKAQDGTIYRVQVGAYGVKANAEAMQRKLKAAGFNGVIVEAE